MEELKSDRAAFKMHHTNENCNNYDYWKTKTFEERLQAANYLNSVAI